MISKINSKIIPFDSLFRALCLTPYYGHSKGCMNYNHKKGCPPGTLINEILDFNQELYVIFTENSVGEFAERMRISHPEWKESQYPDQNQKTIEYVARITDKLKQKYPNWPEEHFPSSVEDQWTSSRQWYNPRRWQSSARKKHEKEIQTFLSKNPHLIIERVPEGRGVNLTGLMHELGIEINWQWPPPHNIENKTYVISLAGYPLNVD